MELPAHLIGSQSLENGEWVSKVASYNIGFGTYYVSTVCQGGGESNPSLAQFNANESSQERPNIVFLSPPVFSGTVDLGITGSNFTNLT